MDNQNQVNREKIRIDFSNDPIREKRLIAVLSEMVKLAIAQHERAAAENEVKSSAPAQPLPSTGTADV